ncbi:MAG: hypothetical protein V1847_02070 [Candidatus Diapherotrites archaeon]
MFDNILRVFWNPEQELENERSKASIGTGLLNYTLIPTIIAFIVGVIVSIGALVLQGIMAANPVTAMIAPLVGIGVVAFVLLPVLVFILLAVFVLLFNLFLWIGMKLRGGAGSFTEQFYLLSTFMPGTYLMLIGVVILAIVGLLLAIILIGFLIYLVAIALGVGISAYISYLWWYALKVTHKTSNKNTVLGITIGIVIPLIVLALIALLLFLIFGALVAGMMGGILSPIPLTGI